MHTVSYKKEMALQFPVISILYHLKNEAFNMLCCQPIAQQYKSNLLLSVIKVVTMKNMDNFYYEKKPSCATA